MKQFKNYHLFSKVVFLKVSDQFTINNGPDILLAQTEQNEVCNLQDYLNIIMLCINSVKYTIMIYKKKKEYVFSPMDVQRPDSDLTSYMVGVNHLCAFRGGYFLRFLVGTVC